MIYFMIYVVGLIPAAIIARVLDIKNGMSEDCEIYVFIAAIWPILLCYLILSTIGNCLWNTFDKVSHNIAYFDMKKYIKSMLKE